MTRGGHVTADDRRLARLQDADRAKIERLGIQHAARIGFHAQQAAVRAWRRRENPAHAAGAILSGAVPLVTDCMVAGHLAGRRRSILSVKAVAPKLALKLDADPSPFRKALDFLAQRLEIEPDEYQRLEQLYHPEALKVVKRASEAVERDLQERLQEAITSGQHVRGGITALRDAFEANGLTPRNSFTLEAIFRTQTQLAYGAGRWTADQDPDVQEILWGYRYVTMEDDRVRPEHAGFDGVTLPKDDPFWDESWPPNGWACRCTAVSIFEPRSRFEPRAVDVDGKIVAPSVDDGFGFNPGKLFSMAG
jgi:SPP1 gp7 family putative phage head morphogenesis protein